MPDHHVKGQLAVSTYVREKGVLLVTQFVLLPVFARVNTGLEAYLSREVCPP